MTFTPPCAPRTTGPSLPAEEACLIRPQPKPDSLSQPSGLSRTQLAAIRWLDGRPLSLGGHLLPLLLGVLSAAFFILAAEPVAWWPLAAVCLVPLAMAAVCSERFTATLLAAAVAAVLAFGCLLNWLIPLTFPGYLGVVALQSLYWIAAAVVLRFGWRLLGWPLAFLLPICWVGFEYLRGIGLLGFAWFYVAHPLYAQLWAIQVCDLAGVHLLSAAVAMLNGAVADIICQPMLEQRPDGRLATPRRLRAALVATAAVWTGVVVYGQIRLAQMDQWMTRGPLVGVLQDDLPMTVADGMGLAGDEIVSSVIELTLQAALADRAAGLQPDLYVWSESMVPPPYYINPEFRDGPLSEAAVRQLFSRNSIARLDAASPEQARAMLDSAVNRWRRDAQDVHEAIEQVTRRIQIPLLVGLTAVVPLPDRTEEPFVRRFNSAMLYHPLNGLQPTRHDKLRPVPFGEQVPFRYGRFHWLYDWLNENVTPYGFGGYNWSLDSGEHLAVFQLDTPGAGDATSAPSASPTPTPGPAAAPAPRFAVLICFESTFSDLVRLWGSPEPSTGRKRADFLLNISNDGWYARGGQLLQHLCLCSFRSVEARVGMARAVNTGISAFVKPTGEIYGRVRRDGTAWTGRGMSPRERQIMRELSGSLPEQEERIARAREQARAAGANPAELHQLAEQLRADADRSRAALLDELRRERAAYGVRGHSTEHVWVANVVTLYTRIGDLFAQILLAGCGCIILLRLAHGLRTRRPGKQAVARQSVATTEDSA